MARAFSLLLVLAAAALPTHVSLQLETVDELHSSACGGSFVMGVADANNFVVRAAGVAAECSADEWACEYSDGDLDCTESWPQPDTTARAVATYAPFDSSGGGASWAILSEAPFTLAVLDADNTKVLIYERASPDALAFVAELDLSGALKNVKTLVGDALALPPVLFVAGNSKNKGVSKSYRGIAKVEYTSGSLSLVWTKDVTVEKGAPTLRLRRPAVGAPGSEVLMISKSFYARVDAETGDELFVSLDEEMILHVHTGGSPPVVAHDATRDVFYSAINTTIRTHDVDTGATIEDQEWGGSPWFSPPTPVCAGSTGALAGLPTAEFPTKFMHVTDEGKLLFAFETTDGEAFYTHLLTFGEPASCPEDCGAVCNSGRRALSFSLSAVAALLLGCII